MNTPNAEAFIAAWHRAVESKALEHMKDLIATDVKLVSPALFQPKVGKATVMELLGDVVASIADYKITKAWVDGNEILFEFNAVVGHYQIQGVDKITLDADGKMVELKVLIRPFTGLKALILAVVTLQMRRAEKNMSLKQKLFSRTAFALKSRFGA